MRKILTFFLIFALTLIFVSCAEKGDLRKEGAELVLTNGNIITLSDTLPKAQALAAAGGRIIAVGSDEEMTEHIGTNTKVIDLKGKTAIPGFIDSHLHFMGLGEAMMELDLKAAKNWDDIVYMVASAADKAKPGTWITGSGWHQEKWNPKPVRNVHGYPYADQLSEAAPYNPVLLNHATGHAIIANQKAMDIAGVTDTTANPPGGIILKDDEGKIAGVFEEEASSLIYKAYYEYLDKRTPEEKESDARKAVLLASQDCLSKGITTVHEAGVSYGTVDLYKALAGEGKLGVRVYVMLGEDNESLKARMKDYYTVGYGDNHVTVRAVKRFIDGAIGSRGAWLFEDYDDLEGHKGLNVTPLEDLEETGRIVMENGFQLCTHAIGDRANNEMLNIYGKLFAGNGEDLRWRIEHAQHIALADIPRFKRLNVIASMQGVHATSDGVFVNNRLGERRSREEAYPWRTLLDSGALICNGTDAPVEDTDPIACYYASVTRQIPGGGKFYQEQSMTRMEALKSYTVNGAYAAFEEDIKGTLENGKLADITVLSGDILEMPDNELPKTEVLYTIVGGKVLFEKDKK